MGSFDLEFELYDAASNGNSVGAAQLLQDVSVIDGVFSVTLDFGFSPFAGDRLWLEVRVRDGASVAALTPLLPRQEVSAAPYALHAEMVAMGAVGTAEINDTQVQRRVAGTCPGGSALGAINDDGSVDCNADSDTDTTYSAGAGLTLSGTEFSADTSVVQSRVGQACSPGTYLSSINVDGSVECNADVDTDTNTTYTAGAGLALNSTEFSADTTILQARVDQACAAGTYLSAINADGSVVCTELPGTLPQSPKLQAGFASTPLAASSGSSYGWISYPEPFAMVPISLLTVDESLDDSGATWLRSRREESSRIGIRGDALVDGVHWLAMDPGSYTIDGKQVEANSAPLAINGQTITFSSPFAVPPVVLISIDESGDNNGATRARVINATTTGFTVFIDAGGLADGLKWVALEAGDYSYGPWRWRAGTFDISGCSTCTFALSPAFAATPTMLMTIYDTNNSGPLWARVVNLSTDSLTARTDSTSGEFLFYLAIYQDF